MAACCSRVFVLTPHLPWRVPRPIQIKFLVGGLEKKNQSASVAELNELVNLYGQDARIFLLTCLVDQIDFRDSKAQQKSAAKVREFAVQPTTTTTTTTNRGLPRSPVKKSKHLPCLWRPQREQNVR